MPITAEGIGWFFFGITINMCIAEAAVRKIMQSNIRPICIHTTVIYGHTNVGIIIAQRIKHRGINAFYTLGDKDLFKEASVKCGAIHAASVAE